MKTRTSGFLGDSIISHDSEPFDYIIELHDYLWRFVRVFKPGAGGSLREFLDETIEELESKAQS